MGSKKCGESDLRYQVECSMFQSENHFLLSAQQILHINQNHIRIPPHPLAWLPSRTQAKQVLARMWGKKDPLSLLVEMQICTTTMEEGKKKVMIASE
jgi:hypothetical protein